MMAWMMAVCVAIGAALLYLAYRFGRLKQRLIDVESKQ